MGDPKQKVLVALDFDHTIIDGNSDTHINKLAPQGIIPDTLKSLYRKDGWTLYMREVFRFLYNQGITSEQILGCLTELPLVTGMHELLTSLPGPETELIIISDSNSVFIDHILRHLSLRDNFKGIFTNPAKFDSKGCLNIEMYHLQNWCNLSTKNLCKGEILSSYIEARKLENVEFRTVAYVGDGTNDFCPSLRLQEWDIVFARVGYSLCNHIDRMKDEKGLSLACEVVSWDSGKLILERLLKCYEFKNKIVPSPRLRDSSSFNTVQS